MFNKKYKETIQELEFQKATKEECIKELKEEIQGQKEEIHYLKKCIEELKEENIEELCKDYRYAILVEDYNKVYLWNNGRLEHNVRGISFNLDYANLPELEIRK